MGIYYLGAFPIEGGGVTLKNQYLFDSLRSNKVSINKVDFNKITRKKNIFEFVRLLFVLFCPFNRFCIGISTGKNSRRRFTKLLYWLNPRAMKKSVIMIMGGTVADEISLDPSYCKWMSRYKKVYVETPNMKNVLETAGLTNCDVYPNCRFNPHHAYPITENKQLTCVFFSYIVPQKGVDIIIEAAQSLPFIKFVFYGFVPDFYKETFLSKISSISNIDFRGNFRGNSEDIYRELNKYDILLFPTNFKTEGVPGILVEAKIAGIVPVVSNLSHNEEIILNNVEGIVMNENTTANLVNVLSQLDSDRNLLKKLKVGSQNSASRYYIENYIEKIIQDLNI